MDPMTRTQTHRYWESYTVLCERESEIWGGGSGIPFIVLLFFIFFHFLLLFYISVSLPEGTHHMGTHHMGTHHMGTHHMGI